MKMKQQKHNNAVNEYWGGVGYLNIIGDNRLKKETIKQT